MCQLFMDPDISHDYHVPSSPAAVLLVPFFLVLAGGGLEVTNSLMRALTSSFSSSFKSGNPSRSAGVSIFLVVARALYLSEI